MTSINGKKKLKKEKEILKENLFFHLDVFYKNGGFK